ncbi:S8 family serine peptidase [Chloroflexota bacterium]
MRWLFSITVAFALTVGTAGYAFAQPAHAEKVDVLVSFTGKPGPAEQALIHNAGGKVKRNYHIVPTVAASIPKGKLDSIRRNLKVTSVEEDITVQIIEEVLPWGVDRVDAEAVHGRNKGRGVKIAILDTGIDLDHPDLRVAGDVTFIPEWTNGDDDNGHGTMVAGVVAALDNDIGVVGVAPEVELYAVKVLNEYGSGAMSIILSGIEWAIDNNMQVINMSFGGILNWPSSVIEALEKAYQAGIVLVAGAGNAGDRDIIFSPARYEPVIAVGATDQQDARASFSCTGSTLELMAPGIGILSTSRGGGYSSGSGTSFSTPHVTGVAALLIASGFTYNIEVRQILRGTAQDLGPAGWDSWYGYGLVNAAEAMIVSHDAVSNNELSDTIPPTTRIEIHGLQGDEGWYRSDVRVELTAVDNAGSSGIAETQYSLDGGKTWQSYDEPFTIANEGINTIQTRSRDNAGNLEEAPASREIKIDKTGPSVNISVSPSIICPANHKEAMVNVLVTSPATDELSRLRSFQLSVKDEYGQVEPTMEPRFQSQIQLEAWRDGCDLDGRAYTIIITATDYAGNSAMAETTVTVPHDRRKEGVK